MKTCINDFQTLFSKIPFLGTKLSLKQPIETKKKIKQAKKSQSKIGLKEIRLRMRIRQHDIESKKKQIISFLEEGNKVKISLLMRGRENAYPDLGVEILKKINDDLENVSEIDKPPSLEGRTLSIIIAPK